VIFTPEFIFTYFNLNMRILSARSRLFVTASLCGFLAFSPAQAQDADLPGSADPGRALEDLQLPARPDQTLEREESSRKAVTAVPEGMEQLKFTLQSVTIDGMSAYEPGEVRPLYEQYLGREISVADLFEIMTRVQQKYLDDGYALTKVLIPNQNIQSGEARLSVIEGHVEEVEIADSVKKTFAVLHAADLIAAMRPLNVKKLERIMLLLNDLPDAKLGAVLATPNNSASAEAGAVRLILQGSVERKNRGNIGFDNYGSKFTGPYQANASASTTGIGFDHSELSVAAYSAIPLKEQRVVSTSYSVPLFGISGTQMSVSASKAWTQPGSSLSLLDIQGASESVEMGISYPIIRQRDMTLKVDGGFEWKNARTEILGEELYDDRLRIAKAGVNFNFTDSLAGFSVLDVRYAQGLNIFGVRENGSVDLSRQDGRPDFKKFTFLAARLQGLPLGFELLGVMQGQYSFDPLLSSEEFGFGGSQIGRGYDPSEITGDRGIAGSLELRYKMQTQLIGGTLNLQPYAFYDIGKVWNIDAGAEDNISAASVGAGVRLDFGDGWKGDLNFARPMTKSADNEPKYQNDVGSRILFSISKSF